MNKMEPLNCMGIELENSNFNWLYSAIPMTNWRSNAPQIHVYRSLFVKQAEIYFYDLDPLPSGA
jgi:hypothetical protein